MIQLALDFADYPSDRFEARRRQRLCSSAWVGCSPLDYWSIHLGQVPGSGGLEKNPMILTWPRDGYPSHSGKHVPFVHDLLDTMVEKSRNGHYIGFINSDIYPLPHLWPEVRKAFEIEEADIVFLHRVDVTEGALLKILKALSEDPTLSQELTKGPKFGKKVSPGISCDGVLMTQSAWRDTIKPIYPDFVTGEPWWDTAILHLSRHCHLKAHSVTSNSVLHIAHPMGWHPSTRGAGKAKEMFRIMRQELK